MNKTCCVVFRVHWMARLLKIYGERNTNTNHLSQLVQLNLKVKQLRGTAPPYVIKLQQRLPGKELVRDIYFSLTFSQHLGWKHSCIKPASKLERYALVNDDLTFLTITKNPYSWLLSLYKRPYHQHYIEKPNFEKFLSSPWGQVGRERLDGNIINPIELWNIKNRSYLNLTKFNVLNLTSEKIISAPGQVIDQISHIFSIEKKSEKFLDMKRSTKDANKDSDFYLDYYLNEKWKSEISSREIALINGYLDRELMEHFDYKIIE